jgi:hypothetical protein
MVATSVLAFGLVLVYQAFFITLDAATYVSTYLEVSPWADEMIWEAQDSFRRTGRISGDTSGQTDLAAAAVSYDLAQETIDPKSGLYRLTLTASWRQARKERQLIRAVQIFHGNDTQ